MSFFLGFAVIAAALVTLALRSGNPALLLDPYAAVLIAGGVCGSFFIICPFSAWPGVLSAMGRALRPARGNTRLLHAVEGLAASARRDGILALEAGQDEIEDPMLHKGVLLLLESAEPAAVRSILEKDAESLGEREQTAQEVLERLAVFAPGIGMVGTLVEIVQMLGRFKAAAALAPLIAHALLPLVYGAAASYLLLFPLAARVRVSSSRHREARRVAIEGVLAIQAGEPPSLIRERLESVVR